MQKEQAIILDTNFWLSPYELRVDILGGLEDLFEYKPYIILVPTPVLDELKMMASIPGKKNYVAARSALEVIDRLVVQGKAKHVVSKGKADDILISLSKKEEAWVATNDKMLRLRLKEEGIKTVIIKDSHKVQFA
ncbi:MAG: PIN domain-containing protein [Candidatus Micrarchaeia archaeon]